MLDLVRFRPGGLVKALVVGSGSVTVTTAGRRRPRLAANTNPMHNPAALPGSGTGDTVSPTKLNGVDGPPTPESGSTTHRPSAAA